MLAVLIMVSVKIYTDVWAMALLNFARVPTYTPGVCASEAIIELTPKTESLQKRSPLP